MSGDLLNYTLLFFTAAAFLFTLIHPNATNILSVEDKYTAQRNMMDASGRVHVMMSLLRIKHFQINIYNYEMRLKFVDKHILGSRRVSSVWFRFHRRLVEIRSRLRD